MAFGDVIRSSDAYCAVLSFASKLTKIEDVLCLRTMKGRGHNILLNQSQSLI